jgi:hypothetical protein
MREKLLPIKLPKAASSIWTCFSSSLLAKGKDSPEVYLMLYCQLTPWLKPGNGVLKEAPGLVYSVRNS